MRMLVLLPFLAGCAAAAAPPVVAPPPAPLRILAVFAHPDDETVAGPALANAARRGAHVRIVYATRGDASASQTDLAPGVPIAARRSEEALCAARALGAADPLLLDFGDGHLGAVARPTWAPLHRLEQALRTVLTEERPDVVITWGPDGGYGHPDHRLVGDVVTQMLAGEGEGRPTLLYPAVAIGAMPPLPPTLALPFAETAPDLLTVRAQVTPADLEAAGHAFACHASQYDAPTRAALVPLFGASVWRDGVAFRPAFGRAAGDDLLMLGR